MSKHALKDVEGFCGRKEHFAVDPRFIIVKNGWNARTDFSGEEELRDSIIHNGVLVPLRVRKIDNTLELVDGERRLRATLRAIKEGNDILSVPAILERKNISDTEALFNSLVSNDGKRLEPLEEAEAFRRLASWGVPVKDIARRMGRSTVFVYERLKLVDASPDLKQAIEEKEVSIRTAAKIVTESNGNPERQQRGIDRSKLPDIIRVSWNGKNGDGVIKCRGRSMPGRNGIPVNHVTLFETFNCDFLDEMQEMGADLRTAKIVFKIRQGGKNEGSVG